jgi:hypothetical protein
VIPPLAVDLLDAVVEILPRVAQIALLIAIGVFLANLLVEFGLVESIAGLSTYLTRPASLPDPVGAAILTTAASTTAGYGMLADYRESGALSDRATLVAVTINTFFGFVQHIFTFYAPVLIPILGLEVGLLYVGSRAAIALAITVVGLVGGALLLGPEDRDDAALGRVHDDASTATDGGETASGKDPADSEEDSDRRSALSSAAASSRRTLRRVLPRLVIVYTLVVLLVQRVDLERMASVADPLIAWTGLPGESLPIVAVFAFDTTAGATAIAPLVGESFTARTAVATMLIGGIVSFAVSTFKRSIPFQYGIWGPTFGSKVIVVNTALKVVVIGLAVVVLLVPAGVP